MTVLVTGGAGYIGSHTVLELLKNGHHVIVIDNLSNGSHESIKRVEEITSKNVTLYIRDVQDEIFLDSIFNKHVIDAVIHFAGFKSVHESVLKPLQYYENNINSTIVLLKVMEKYEIKKLIFSSSACVYGTPKHNPVLENDQLQPQNPYGWTKFMIEQILSDIIKTNQNWCITALRYFNPIGAHESGRIGEDPTGTPDNILPYISQVSVGKQACVKIFGDDYPTIDGTGVRDYVHVTDLARAHIAALKHATEPNKYKVYNIGTGKGTSVLEIITAFEKASKQAIPHTIVARRPGDVGIVYCDTTLAEKELHWKAVHTVEKSCIDSWRWQSQNPYGYTQK